MRAAWPPRALRCAAGRAEVSSCITSSTPRRVNPSPDHGERQRWPPAPAWTPTSPPPPRSSWEKAPWSGSRHGGWRPGWSTGRARSPALAPGQNQQVRSWPPTFSEQFPRKLDQSELVIKDGAARVRVVLRRHGNDSETGKMTLADLELDDEAHEVRRHGHVVELTNTEYRLLRYLLINAGRVLSRSQILDHVWHYDFGGDASVLETYISYLRRKVDRYDPALIQTVRGVGYVLRTPRK